MINAWPRLTYFSLSVINSLHLILGFFGLKEGEDIHGNMLGSVVQHAIYPRKATRIFLVWIR